MSNNKPTHKRLPPKALLPALAAMLFLSGCSLFWNPNIVELQLVATEDQIRLYNNSRVNVHYYIADEAWLAKVEFVVEDYSKLPLIEGNTMKVVPEEEILGLGPATQSLYLGWNDGRNSGFLRVNYGNN